MTFRNLALGIALAATTALSAVPVSAQDMRFFRIASGSAGGTYYPIAGLLAQVISNPPGARSCADGGNCGMEGLVAIAQSSHGAVENVNAIDAGQVESGFVQSGVAYWAYTGSGMFDGKKPVKNLCVLASLYPEHIHVVAGVKSGIRTVDDFKGKTIGMGLHGSGALVGARLVVGAYGLEEKRDFKPQYVKSLTGADMIRDGQADAFMTVTGYPNTSIAEMAAVQGARLIPVDGAARDKLMNEARFYSSGKIPGGTYKGNDKDVETVAVSALWVSNTGLGEDLHYGVVKGLFGNRMAPKLLKQGHAKGGSITLKTSQDGVPIPLCPGAEKFYKEKGIVK